MTRSEKLFWFCLLCAVVLLASCNRVKASDLAVMPSSQTRLIGVTHTARAAQAKSATASVGGQRAVNLGNVTVAMATTANVEQTNPPPTKESRVQSTIISDSLLNAIAQIESSNNPNAIGDGGKALGLFQLHRAAWEDARKINPLIGDYSTGALNPEKSRQAARIYLTNLAARFQRATGRAPEAGEMYALYNCGLTGFRRVRFQVSSAPISTQRAIKRLEKML